MRLLVFSDDWGRHPSSCQHLIGELLPSHDVTWVNTIGMRPPRMDLLTLKRGFGKLRGWFSRTATDDIAEFSSERSPAIIDTKMWPWMSHRWDRFVNAELLTHQLAAASRDAVAITTIPIVADLVGRLPVKRWIYYCVDDFSVWPGLDGKALGRMEDQLVAKVDSAIAVSDHLVQSLNRRGCQAELLTHGVNLEFWAGQENQVPDGTNVSLADAPVVFWGVVDRRMNAEWVLALADRIDQGRVVLAGPQQDPDPRLLEHPRIEMPGPIPYRQLPLLASNASVLVMPYADLPVTRAMQPLKLKEYLATGKPVVVSPLPATAEWGEFLEVVDCKEDFVQAVLNIVSDGFDPSDPSWQARATALSRRLAAESWNAKAGKLLEAINVA